MLLLVGLGVWQLQRAEEKQLILSAVEGSTPLTALPAAVPELPAAITLTGTLLPDRYFLLDNRTRGGRPGYELLAVLLPAQGQRAVLLNLGWLAAKAERQRLPTVALPVQPLTVDGWLTSAEPGFMLSEQSWVADGRWPLRIQQPDLSAMADLLGLPLYPAIMRAARPLVAGLDSRWQPVNMPPEKHRAYALQWFAMALVSLLWLVWWYRQEVGR